MSMMQRTVLDAMGVPWYVRRQFVSRTTQHIQQNVTAQEAVPSLSVQAEPSRSNALIPPSITHLLEETAPKKEMPQPKELKMDVVEKAPAEPVPAPVEATVEFNWLVVDVANIVFVCDIKPKRLNGIWHTAALELLSDIAIAMRQPGRLASQYFNWPVQMDFTIQLQNVDLEGVVSSFLERGNTELRYVLLGDNAKSYAQIVETTQPFIVGPSLGELFKNVEAKKQLWSKIKPSL